MTYIKGRLVLYMLSPLASLAPKEVLEQMLPEQAVKISQRPFISEI